MYALLSMIRDINPTGPSVGSGTSSLYTYCNESDMCLEIF